jgi:hypothetical protein
MEPIEILLTALATGAAVAGKTMVSEAVKDGYGKLKNLLVRKSGRKKSCLEKNSIACQRNRSRKERKMIFPYLLGSYSSDWVS